MRKLLRTCLLVGLISCAAVWGTQQIRLFQRLPMALSSLIFAADSVSNEGRASRPDTQEFQAPTHPNSQGKEQPQRREMVSLLERWKNVFAYFSIIAGVAMLTYYSEQGLRKFIHRRDGCFPAS